MTLDKIVNNIAEGTTEMGRNAIEKEIIERVKNSIDALGIKTEPITKEYIVTILDNAATKKLSRCLQDSKSKKGGSRHQQGGLTFANILNIIGSVAAVIVMIILADYYQKECFNDFSVINPHCHLLAEIVLDGGKRKTRRKTRRNKGRQVTPYSDILYERRIKEHKKKHCGKYYKGAHGIRRKACKKDPKCIYGDHGSGGEWCFTKKRKYTKRKKSHSR